MIRSRTSLSRFIACLLLTAPAARAQIKNDFSLYPSGAQGCLNDASDSSNCSGDTVPEMNACLCSNGGSFVTNAARCIGREARNTLRIVWSTMNTACDDSNTPLAVTEDDFINIGERETESPTTRSTTSTSSPTETATDSGTPSPTNTGGPGDDENKDGGLSTGAIAGIAVGSALVVAIVGAVIAMIWKSRRSRAAHDEASQSMLGGHTPEAPIGLYSSPHGGWKGPEEKPGWRPVSGVTDTTSSTPSSAWPSGPGSSYQHQSWGHHPDQPWPGSPQYQQQGHPLGVVPENPSSNQGPGIYELSSAEPAMMPPPSHQAFEMPASPGPPNAPHYPGANWAR